MKKIIATGLILSTFLYGSQNLIVESKKAGLIPIPTSKYELNKLTYNIDNPSTIERIELGKKLFFDPRLSKSGLISCNTCHNLSMGGVDGLSSAVGHKWISNPHNLNSPTVYNSVFMSKQFWDGRNITLEEQAGGPILAGPEMASTKEHVEEVVNSIPEYIKGFKKAYSNNIIINFKKITDTISIFERSLVTPSRFDDFLNGNKKALSNQEKIGLKTFIDKGCVTCHNGVGIGGTMQPLGVSAAYKYNNVGDFKGDKNGMVKTPTLRNITLTAPYFHNGQIKTLPEAIEEMGRIQLGVKLTPSEISDIHCFLKTLEGKNFKMNLPVLPKSTNHTPLPNID
jgi:cytochrome c peroxidase